MQFPPRLECHGRLGDGGSSRDADGDPAVRQGDPRGLTLERGLALAPVVTALAQWGMPSLTMSNAVTDDPAEPEVFDHTWAIADPRLIADETYQWTVDGVDTELVVFGGSLVRPRRQARNPVATMVTATAVLSALAAGDTTVANAVESGELVLSGPQDAIRRMFIATALPGSVT